MQASRTQSTIYNCSCVVLLTIHLLPQITKSTTHCTTSNYPVYYSLYCLQQLEHSYGITSVIHCYTVTSGSRDFGFTRQIYRSFSFRQHVMSKFYFFSADSPDSVNSFQQPLRVSYFLVLPHEYCPLWFSSYQSSHQVVNWLPAKQSVTTSNPEWVTSYN